MAMAVKAHKQRVLNKERVLIKERLLGKRLRQ
jgi:hypothetical protein